MGIFKNNWFTKLTGKTKKEKEATELAAKEAAEQAEKEAAEQAENEAAENEGNNSDYGDDY